MVKGDTHMPDFAAIAGLLGNIKSIFDFTAGITGSLSGFTQGQGQSPSTWENIEALFGSVSGS